METIVNRLVEEGSSTFTHIYVLDLAAEQSSELTNI